MKGLVACELRKVQHRLHDQLSRAGRRDERKYRRTGIWPQQPTGVIADRSLEFLRWIAAAAVDQRHENRSAVPHHRRDPVEHLVRPREIRAPRSPAGTRRTGREAAHKLRKADFSICELRIRTTRSPPSEKVAVKMVGDVGHHQKVAALGQSESRPDCSMTSA